MDVRKEMEKNFITLLSKLILDKEDDTPFRLSAQEDALKKLECKRPELGKWIDDCDFPFLIETLLLEDVVFCHEFPGVRLTAEERKEFAHALEAHCEDCAHCHLKRSYDLEWQSRVNRAIADNKEDIGKVLAHAAGKK